MKCQLHKPHRECINSVERNNSWETKSPLADNKVQKRVHKNTTMNLICTEPREFRTFGYKSFLQDTF
jgi:hypothetical protein